jgi:hypothetical protein
MKHIHYLTMYFGTMERLLFFILSDDGEFFEGI